MMVPTNFFKAFAFVCLATVGLVHTSTRVIAEENNTAAHDLADKFSTANKPRSKAPKANGDVVPKEGPASRAERGTKDSTSTQPNEETAQQNKVITSLIEKIRDAEKKLEQAKREANEARQKAEVASRKAYEKEMLARAAAESLARQQEADYGKAESDVVPDETYSQLGHNRQRDVNSNTVTSHATYAPSNSVKTSDSKPGETAATTIAKEERIIAAAKAADAERREYMARERLARQREDEANSLLEKLRRAEQAQRRVHNKSDLQTASDQNSSWPNQERKTTKTTAIDKRNHVEDSTAISAFPEQRAPKFDRAAKEQPQVGHRIQLDPTVTQFSKKTRAPRKKTYSSIASGNLSKHATVLLVMTPGKKGIRRWKKTADPMLCFENHCYISRGESLPAQRIKRARGFGPGIALGKRAGACNNSLTCVFRNVQIAKDGPTMQPIDLRLVRHDRRARRTVVPDDSCRISREGLRCFREINGGSWRAWVIAEEFARKAGSARLLRALALGLEKPPTRTGHRQ